MSVYDFKRNIINVEGGDVSDMPIVIRAATWNIGHFSMGEQDSSTILSANASTKALEYTACINDAAPQIMGICSYSDNFTSDGTEKTADYVFSGFDRHLVFNKDPFSQSNGHLWNTLFTNGFSVIDAKQYRFDNRDNGQYYILVTLNINNKVVYVVQTHLSGNHASKGAKYRLGQMGELVALLNNLNAQYAIIMGDFNTEDNNYAVFTDAEYTLANGGYADWVTTYGSNYYSDNIIVKGFQPLNFHRSEDSIALSNHYMIYTDLVML